MSQSGLAGMGVALGLTALFVNFSIHKIEEGKYDLSMKHGLLLL